MIQRGIPPESLFRGQLRRPVQEYPDERLQVIGGLMGGRLRQQCLSGYARWKGRVPCEDVIRGSPQKDTKNTDAVAGGSFIFTPVSRGIAIDENRSALRTVNDRSQAR